jgi:ribosomal protein S7
MSRIFQKKRFPETDAIYNSYLVSLLITRILKSGKKTTKKIVYEAFDIIKRKQMKIPLTIFEKQYEMLVQL